MEWQEGGGSGGGTSASAPAWGGEARVHSDCRVCLLFPDATPPSRVWLLPAFAAHACGGIPTEHSILRGLDNALLRGGDEDVRVEAASEGKCALADGVFEHTAMEEEGALLPLASGGGMVVAQLHEDSAYRLPV